MNLLYTWARDVTVAECLECQLYFPLITPFTLIYNLGMLNYLLFLVTWKTGLKNKNLSVTNYTFAEFVSVNSPFIHHGSGMMLSNGTQHQYHNAQIHEPDSSIMPTVYYQCMMEQTGAYGLVLASMLTCSLDPGLQVPHHTCKLFSLLVLRLQTSTTHRKAWGHGYWAYSIEGMVCCP